MNSNLETKKMIETNEPTEGTVVKQETPTQITTTMIINDLESGISRDGIREKYGLEVWEVTQMFQHPSLKGKKVKKVRKLSFTFVDDTENAIDPNQTSIPVEDRPLLNTEPESFDEEEDENEDEDENNEFKY